MIEQHDMTDAEDASRGLQLAGARLSKRPCRAWTASTGATFAVRHAQE
jgi:hypothetical protein